jgi:nitrogen regulatory protein P-II 1
MKKIEAIVRPFKLDDVREALKKIGLLGMTVTEVKGCGREKGHIEIYRGSECQIDLLPKMKIEIILPDAIVKVATNAIQRAAHTGKFGDGKIFVYSVATVIHIRTQEESDDTYQTKVA